MAIFGIAVKKPPAGIDSFTKLMLHGDESPLVDSSLSPHALTLEGGIVRSATQSKFGGYSISFNGSDQDIIVADSDDWHFGSDDFTIDFWVRFTSIDTYETFFKQGLAADPRWQFSWGTSGIYFYAQDGGGAVMNATEGDATPPPTNTWIHYAAAKSGSTLRVFEQGIQIAIDNSAGTFVNSTAPLYVGAFESGTIQHLNGFMDEARISNGISRWESDFTPETEAYS